MAVWTKRSRRARPPEGRRLAARRLLALTALLGSNPLGYTVSAQELDFDRVAAAAGINLGDAADLIVDVVDVDGNGEISAGDVIEATEQQGRCDGDPVFNPAADLNRDGCVDWVDLTILNGVASSLLGVEAVDPDSPSQPDGVFAQ